MSELRSRRIADRVRTLIAETIAREAHDPRLREVLITEVRVSPDYRLATVYYSVLTGDGAARDAAGQALERARGFLRREVGRGVQLRVVPELRFLPDLSADHAMRIERALADIHAHDAAAAADAEAREDVDGPDAAAADGDDQGKPE